MTNAELIEALRKCGSTIGDCGLCFYKNHPTCHFQMMIDAADAIERLVAEVDRKDKAIQGLLDAVDRKNTDIKKWKAAWKTAYKLYEAKKESKGEHDGTEQNKQ